eukprot:2428371-Rhodomonas_salina.1
MSRIRVQEHKCSSTLPKSPGSRVWQYDSGMAVRVRSGYNSTSARSTGIGTYSRVAVQQYERQKTGRENEKYNEHDQYNENESENEGTERND